MMTTTRLEDIPSPSLISEESVKKNVEELKKIKLEMEKSNDEMAKKMLELIASEINIEGEMRALLNSLQPYYEKAVEVSKAEKALKDEMTLLMNFEETNHKSLGTAVIYKEYTTKINSISNNFSELQRLKLELDTAHVQFQTQINQLNIIYNTIKKNNSLFDIMQKYVQLTISIENKSKLLDTMVQQTFEEIRNEKKKPHSKSSSSTSQKHSKNKTREKSNTIEIKKEPQIEKKQTKSFENLVNESKIHHDQQTSIIYPYKTATESYSSLVFYYNSCVEIVDNFKMNYNLLTERREQIRRERQQAAQKPVSSEARQQYAHFQPAERSRCGQEVKQQNNSTYQNGMK